LSFRPPRRDFAGDIPNDLITSILVALAAVASDLLDGIGQGVVVILFSLLFRSANQREVDIASVIARY
jgi:MFS superfamily sulfate permease-like transporter